MKVTVRIVTFEMCRFGRSGYVSAEELAGTDLVGVWDGNGVAHPTSRAQSRAATSRFKGQVDDARAALVAQESGVLSDFRVCSVGLNRFGRGYWPTEFRCRAAC